MTEFTAWDIGTYPPPGAARAQDGRRIRIVPNPAIPVPVVHATPLLDVETEVWAKPSAAACFPIHPLGVLVLYRRARQLFASTGLLSSFGPEQLSDAERCMWRFAAKLYSPGVSIRTCIDEAIESRHFSIRKEDHDDPYVAQPASLVAWAVLRAALDWAKETST